MSSLAWFWHTVFDGTWACRCPISRIMKEQHK